jgi:hypothetical protein
LLAAHGTVKIVRRTPNGAGSDEYTIAFEDYGELAHQTHALSDAATGVGLEKLLSELGISIETKRRVLLDIRKYGAAEIFDVVLDSSDFIRLFSGAKAP